MKMKANITVLILGLALVIASCTPQQKEKAASKPNIVFILADDLGYGDVSCFNENSKINTPNIDKLATNGVMFTDAHTSSAVCTPTRYGILTGRYNWRSTLKKGVLSGYSKALITPDRTTVAAFLKNNGYTTAYIGKWHLGWDWHIADENTKNINKLDSKINVDYSQPVTNGPDAKGFDYSYGFCGSLDMPPYVWVENGKPTLVPTKETVKREKQAWWRKGPTSDDFVHEQVLPHIAEKAVAFIKDKTIKEKPFFLYLPLSAPHTPILPTPEFQGKSGLENPYGDFVIMVDWVVGEVKKALDEEGITGNTLLIFTSDNGCSNQADFEQLASKGHDPSYVFRGHKADIFEGGHRVPYIVSWPGKVNPGKSEQLVCTTDLFATVADVIGATYPDNTAEDSYSILPALKLPSNAKVRTSIVHHSINGSFAYRKGDWKVNFCPGSGGWSDPKPNSKGIELLPPVQLYNLADDIGEENNLQAENPKIIEEFRAELSEIVRNGRSTPGEPQKNDGPETWPQLKWMNENIQPN